MDIGINYLGDPWGFQDLSRDQKIDLLAYWHIQKTANTSRWLQSTPATIRDLYDILLTSNNKAPRGLFDTVSKGIDPTMRKHWQNKTGSSNDSINWWARG